MSGLLERFYSGDRAALARLLTHVENRTDLGREALTALQARSPESPHIVGVTGPPGAGKSTLVNQIVTRFRSRGRSVAVLAIDPSSPVTGGATLGDRIRMLEHGDDDGVFVRSMASRGQLGGLALATFDAARLLAVFGFDVVLIETVGVGQDEVDIAALADTVLLLQVPGLGDGVQSVKAGILEIADVVAVNKADLPGSRDLVRELRLAIRQPDNGWSIPLVLVSALTGDGVDGLCDRLEDHRRHLECSGSRTRQEARTRFHARLIALELIDRRIRRRLSDFDHTGLPKGMDSTAIAEWLLDEITSEHQRLKRTPADRASSST